MLITSIILFLFALYITLLDVYKCFVVAIKAAVHGKDLIINNATLPLDATDVFIVTVLWTAFYVSRVLA